MEDLSPRQVADHMLENDRFSNWLGIEMIDVRPGYCKIRMTLRDEMLNGFGRVHGGIAFSFADSAFAFACNNRNNLSVALDTSITFTKALFPGDCLEAEAIEVHNGRSTGHYLITVRDNAGKPVAHFRGTCFRTGQKLI